jgi:hypothetical protein
MARWALIELSMPQSRPGTYAIGSGRQRPGNYGNAFLKTDSPEPAAADAGPLMALVLAECREIRICQQLATGAKHFEVKRRNDPDIVTSFEEAMHLVEFGSGEEKETVFLQGKAVFVKDGTQSYSDLGLFSRALAYWNGFFERYGVQ